MTLRRRSTAGEVIDAIPRAILTIMVICLVAWMAAVGTWESWSVWGVLKLKASLLLDGWAWQLVTYQFLHDPRGIWHLLFNMVNLWFFGRYLERRWGIGEFVAFYLTCGIGAGLVFVLLSLVLGVDGALIGASGAVLGLLVACAMIWPYQVISIFGLIPIQMRHLVLIVVVIEILFAWLGTLGSRSPASSVAHLGGMATGWLYVRYGWHVSSFGGLGRRLKRGWASLVWSWRKRRMNVVEQDWDRWLEDDKDDKRPH